jgi:hypothetical protein
MRPVETPAPTMTPRRRRLFSPDGQTNEAEPIPLPELRSMTGHTDAAHAEFPDPPGPRVHYEDSDGPPLPL